MMFLTPGTTVQTMTTATLSTQSCHTSKNGMKSNFYNQSIFFRISSQQTIYNRWRCTANRFIFTEVDFSVNGTKEMITSDGQFARPTLKVAT